MVLDPARWPTPVRLTILGLLLVLVAAAVFLDPRSTVATMGVLLVPAIVGGLIWRFDGLPWIDIASWTLPLVLWTAILESILPRSVSLLVGGVTVGGWVYAFIFWTRVTRWWYRWLLRKPFPGLRTETGGA